MEARKKADLSQIEVARALGYKTAQFISDWERDKFRVPIDKIEKLAALYKLKPKMLLFACHPEIKKLLR